MVISHLVSTSVFQSGTGNRTVTPPSTLDGDLLVVPVGYQDSAATTITTPSGFTSQKSMVATGTLKTSLFIRTKQAGDTTWTYAPNQSVETSHLVLSIGGCDPTSLIIGADGTRAASGAAFATTAPSITTTAPNTRVYIIGTERTTANETVEATVNNGFTKISHTFANGTSAESLFIAYKDMPTPGAVGATTITYQNTQGSNAYAVLIAVAPSTVAARRGFNDVAEMSAKNGATWAHRGGSASYPEHSLYAYQQAALRGYGALELSMQRTSDGVWFGCHDLTLARVTGNAALTTDVRTMTWAQVNAYQITIGAAGAPQPFMRWQDFIAAGFGNTHVLILDPKNSVGSYQSEFLAMVAADVNPNRVIMKWAGGLTSFATAANAAGFKTAGYWYQADYDNGNLAAESPYWDFLGMDLTASTAWTGTNNILSLASAQGKKVWGHIAANQTDYNTAMSKGSNMVQSAGVAVITPVSWWNDIAANGSLATSGTATRSVNTATTAAGVLALSGAASRTIAGTRIADGALSLTGTATRVSNLARTADGILTLTGSGQIGAAAVERDAAGTLSLTGSAERTVAVGRAATETLAVSGSATATGSAFRSTDGLLTLTGAASVTVAITRSAQGALALGGIGSVTFQIVRTAMGILSLAGVGAIPGRVTPERLTLTDVAVSHTLTPVAVTHTLEDA